MSVTVQVPSQAGRPAIEARPGRWARLFPTAEPGRFTRRTIGLAVLALGAGAATSLLRTGGTGALQSIWEEDARDILDGALNTPGWGAVGRPVAGYFLVGPRLIGEFTTLFPLSWAAAVLSITAALITAALALLVYCASQPFFPSPVWGRLARAAVSAPLVAVPIAENRFTEVSNRPVCLHFFAAYALFWVLLWTPATVRGRIAAGLTVALTGVSTILIVGWLPLAAFRLAVRRDRWSLALAGLVTGGATLQLLGLWTGVSTRPGSALDHPDPYWLTRTFAGWGLPSSLFGFRATSGLSGVPLAVGVARNWFVVGLAWLLVLAVIGLARLGQRGDWLRPRWTLAATAAASGVWFYALTAVANGGIAYRYLVPIQLLFFTVAVALLWPEPAASGRTAVLRGAPLVALAAALLVAAAANYRWADTYRSHAPLWTDQVRQAAAACHNDRRLEEVVVRGAPQPWWSIVRLPCHDLRPVPVGCAPPTCTWLDPPVSIASQRGRYEG